MSEEIASAFVRVRPNMAGFKGETEKGVKSAFGGVGKIIGEAFLGVEAFKFAKETVAGAASIQKSTEVITNEFGRAGKAVKDFNDNAAAKLGISAATAEATSAKFGILFKNMGVGKSTAATMTVNLEKLAGSLSAIRGVTPDAALGNLSTAMLGNLRSLKALGLSIDQHAIKNEALKLGIATVTKTSAAATVADEQRAVAQERLTEAISKHGAHSVQAMQATIGQQKAEAAYAKAVGGSVAALTPAQKAQAIYALATQHLGDWQRQAAAHAGDLANVQRRLSAEWSNAKDALGEALLPAMERLFGFLADKLPQSFKVAQATVGRAVDVISGAFDRMRDALNPLANMLGGWGEILRPLGGAILGITAAIVAWEAVTKTAAVVQAAFNLVLDANPIGAVIMAVAALAGGLVVLYKRNEQVREVLRDVWADIRRLTTDAVTYLQGLWARYGDTIVADAHTAFAALSRVVQSVLTDIESFWRQHGAQIVAVAHTYWELLKTEVTTVVAVIQAIWQRFGGTFIAIVKNDFDEVKGTIQGALNVIRNTISLVLDVVTGKWGRAWQDLKGIVTGVFQIISSFLRGEVGRMLLIATALGKAIGNGIMAGLRGLGNLVKNLFVGIFNWLEKKAIEAALQIVEPFTHIPGFLGGSWAQSMKKSLQAALDGLNPVAASEGTAIGDNLGRDMHNAAVSWMQLLVSDVTQAVSLIQNIVASAFGTQISGVASGATSFITKTLAAVPTPTTATTAAFTGTGGGIGPLTSGGTGGAGSGGKGKKANMDAGRQKLIKYALSMLGTPYLWGGDHPGGFDCSGLVTWAFSQIGVSLPHSTYAQVGMGRPKNLSNISPGDVVFTRYGATEHGVYNPGPGHEGMYIGGGQVVEAGDPVKRMALSAFIAGGKYAIRDMFTGPNAGAAGGSRAKVTPPALPQDLLDRISRDASKSSALDNTGKAAKTFLIDERKALEQAEAIMDRKVKSSRGPLQATYKKLETELENKLDAVGKLIRDAVIIQGDALLPPSLRSRLTGLKSKFQAMSAMASVMTGDAASRYQAALLVNLQDQATTLGNEEDALQAKLAHAKGKQKKAIQDEFNKVKQSVADTNDQLLSAMESTVQSLQGNVSSIFNTVKTKMDAQFEAATQRMIDALGIKYFQGGAQTPAEKALADFQTAQQQKSLADAYNAAVNDLNAAVLSGDPVEIAAKRAALQAANDAIQQDKLQTSATAERTAADKAYADAVKKITDERQAKEQQMNDDLDALLESILNGSGSLDDLNTIAAKYGVSISEQAIPEMGKLAGATSDLSKAFKDLAALIRKITGQSGSTGGGGAPGTITDTGPNQTYVEPSTPAWTDPQWWHQGLATGDPGTPSAYLVKRRPGGTIVPLGEGGHDEIVSPAGAGAAGVKALIGALSPLTVLHRLYDTNREMLDELRTQTDVISRPAPAFALPSGNVAAMRARR